MKQLTEKQTKYLTETNLGFLATLNPDGSPQLTPMWIDTDGQHVLLNTAIGRVKEKNTRRDSRIAFAVADRNNIYNWMMIRGRITERIEGSEAEAHIDKLAAKYTGAKKFTKNSPSERRIILKISPDHVTAR